MHYIASSIDFDYSYVVKCIMPSTITLTINGVTVEMPAAAKLRVFDFASSKPGTEYPILVVLVGEIEIDARRYHPNE